MNLQKFKTFICCISIKKINYLPKQNTYTLILMPKKSDIIISYFSGFKKTGKEFTMKMEKY